MYAINQAHNTHTVHAAYSPPVAAAATLPLVSEEEASAPASSDMAQRMCVSWLCVDDALFRRVFSVYCGIVVPYSTAPMCQSADALRFGHYVGACLPTLWYVPVHLLPYHRGIDPSERSHRAAYCLQRRCLVRLCIVFTNSASHPSERWHRGCIAKP